MRHQKAGRKFNRTSAHREAMFRNMAMALFRHERIITTVAKAKEARPFIERLITLARKDTLHARRLVMARLGPVAKVDLYDKNGEMTDDTVIQRLFNDLAPRYANRAGGYTRITKIGPRKGDNAPMAVIELVTEAYEPKPAASKAKAEKAPKKGKTAKAEDVADADA